MDMNILSCLQRFFNGRQIVFGQRLHDLIIYCRKTGKIDGIPKSICDNKTRLFDIIYKSDYYNIPKSICNDIIRFDSIFEDGLTTDFQQTLIFKALATFSNGNHRKYAHNLSPLH